MFSIDSKILVVDDMVMVRNFIITCLKNYGYSDISEAKDGLEAWKILLEAKPSYDLVISDWSMPALSGIDLLKKIRADERLKKIPVIMITSESDSEMVAEAAKAGVTNYVIKPFTQEILQKKLQIAYEKCKVA